MDVEYERGSCPACGACERERVAGPDDIRRELESLWEFHLRRVEPGAPVKYLADRAVFSQDPPIALAGCRGCGTVYRDPRECGEDVAALYAGGTGARLSSGLYLFKDGHWSVFQPPQSH